MKGRWILFFLIASMAQAATVKCPDPNTSSLQWGKVPEPWFADPYSLNRPQGEVGTQFVRANILVAGLGRGAVCTYKNSVGFYSIWWPGRIKIPAREDANWIDTYGGFVCTKYAECLFSVADQDSI